MDGNSWGLRRRIYTKERISRSNSDLLAEDESSKWWSVVARALSSCGSLVSNGALRYEVDASVRMLVLIMGSVELRQASIHIV